MKRPLTTKQQFWRDHICAAQQSGMSYAAYAKEHGLNSKALYRWAMTLRHKGLMEPETPAFVQLSVNPPAKSDRVLDQRSAAVIVRLPNAVEIKLLELNREALQWLASL